MFYSGMLHRKFRYYDFGRVQQVSELWQICHSNNNVQLWLSAKVPDASITIEGHSVYIHTTTIDYHPVTRVSVSQYEGPSDCKLHDIATPVTKYATLKFAKLASLESEW